MSKNRKRVWMKRLLFLIAVVAVAFIGLVAYLKTPLPQVEMPVAQQPPLPRPLPHSMHNLPYAATEWPSVHGGPANNDYVPIQHGVEFRREWQALVGMVSLTAPTTGPEGNLYLTSGNPPGKSNLFALDRQGNILWQTPPWQNRDDFDSCAVLNGPIVDTQGDLYVSDCNQFWAFHADGQLKWVVNLPAPAEGTAFQNVDEQLEIINPKNFEEKIVVKRRTEVRSFVTAFFTADGSVGGITLFGDVLIVNRDTGAPVAQPFQLPGAPPPPTQAPPFDKFMVGLMDGRMIQPMFDMVVGRTFKSSNTPAVNALDGRIFVAATGRETGTGALYGLDFVPAEHPGELGIIHLATETVIGKESGSSPAISPDGSQVNMADETGKLYVIDTSDGKIHCVTDNLGVLPSSPSIGGDGTVFTLTQYGAAATDPENCTTKWRLNLDWLLQRELPESLELLLGERFVSGGGTIATTDTGIIMPIILGYNFSLGDKSIPLAVKSYYLSIHPETGTLLAGSVPYEAQDTNDGWTVPLRGGQLVFNNGSLRASMSALFAPLANPLLSLHDLQLLTPKGGIESVRAIRFAEPDNSPGI